MAERPLHQLSVFYEGQEEPEVFEEVISYVPSGAWLYIIQGSLTVTTTYVRADRIRRLVSWPVES